MSYEEIGNMTPDQIYHKMCDRNVLKMKQGRRTAAASAGGISADKDGYVRGRDADGNPIRAKIRVDGKSLAARLNEEAAERERAERAAKKKR